MQLHILILRKRNEGVGKYGCLFYSVHADCDTEYFLPGNGLAYALWMDGTG